MKYGCIGASLAHSFSPEIHAMIGRYDYGLQELRESELAAFLAARDFQGINVTIPYKQAVIPYLDHLSETAAAIGAVNTVVNRGGELWGYNTDYAGLCALIRHIGLDLTGKKVLILGTGGTSRTAAAAAKALGAREILPVSRTAKDGAVLYETAIRLHSDADVIINTTPCGMYPHTEDCPIDPSRFDRLSGVVDVIFNPLSSRLVLSAQKPGIPASGGLYMLVAQAVAAAELFTGTLCEDETAELIYGRLLRQKRNLVLVGMPGSGKTSVGRKAAEILGRPFLDLDEVITSRAGRPISAIFSQDGEAAFRRMESAVVEELAAHSGLVIATGGGCVLRSDNVENLRMNGRLVYLDRPLHDLLPTADRPLADSAEKIGRLYQSRNEIYRAAADVTLPVCGDVYETAAAAVKAFCEE